MTDQHCATHTKRQAATACAACGRPLCRDCVVYTGVGLKCAACTGGKAVAANPAVQRVREWRPTTVGVTVAVVVVLLVGMAAFAIFRPSPMDNIADRQGTAAAGGDEAADDGTDVAFAGDDDVMLRGTLDLPDEQTGHRPAVVIVPGFGPTNRDGVVANGSVVDAVYRDLGEKLADQGLVVLRYDKRGTGQSDANPEGTPLTFEQRVSDAAAAVAYVRNRPEVDGGQVALIGHDEGGLAGLKVAGDDHNLSGLVLLGTPGRPYVEVVTEAYRDTGDEDHDEIADEIEAAVDELLATGELPELPDLGMGIDQVLPEGQDAYLRGLFSIDPTADAAEVSSPVLIVHGERDPNHNADTDVEPLRAALTDAPEVEVLTAPEAGHTLNLVDEEASTDDDMSVDVSPVERDAEALQHIAEWLRAQYDSR